MIFLICHHIPSVVCALIPAAMMKVDAYAGYAHVAKIQTVMARSRYRAIPFHHMGWMARTMDNANS